MTTKTRTRIRTTPRTARILSCCCSLALAADGVAVSLMSGARGRGRGRRRDDDRGCDEHAPADGGAHLVALAALREREVLDGHETLAVPQLLEEPEDGEVVTSHLHLQADRRRSAGGGTRSGCSPRRLLRRDRREVDTGTGRPLVHLQEERVQLVGGRDGGRQQCPVP